MVDAIAFGGGYAFACAVQPGPLQAYLLSQVAARGWRRTLPAALAPLISDGPIALLALIVLGRLPVTAQHGLRIAGGALLFYLAWDAFRHWRTDHRAAGDEEGRTPRTLLQAALVNILNPNPYIGWALVLGPAVLGAWNRAPAHGVALVAAFYVTMVVTLAVLILALGGARLLGIRGQRTLLLLSALILAGLGVYQLVVGLPPLIAASIR